MIDFDLIDRLYETQKKTGVPVAWALCDRRYLIPLDQAAAGISAELGSPLSVSDLVALSERGWFEIRSSCDVPQGVHLYVPPRITLFADLERRGWDERELREFADFEERQVTYCVEEGAFLYVDEDLDLVIRFLEDWVEAPRGTVHAAPPQLAEIEANEARAQALLSRCRTWKSSGVPTNRLDFLEHLAFRFRALNEMTTIQSLEGDRAKLRAGYSPWVSFSGWQYSFEETSNRMVFRPHGRLDWPQTVRYAIASSADPDESREPLIRVKEFVLVGARVVPVTTMTPARYAEAWSERGIEDYLKTLTEIRGDRRCLHCFEALLEDADPRRRFCSETCRNAEKNKRWRTRNPDGNFRAQARYFRSLDPDVNG